MNEAEFEWNPSIASARDLTKLLAESEQTLAATWSNDPLFANVFEQLARVLHRGRSSHVLLTAERGVDLESAIFEFAAKATQDWLPFLQERRVILVDARFTAAEESRDRLLAILSQVAEHRELVVCVVGFATLMRGRQGSNREALLSALGFVQCQLVGFLSNHEYEDLFAGDAEAAEFFTRIDVPEPSPETAQGVLLNYAAALEDRYGLRISAEVVRLATTLCANYILHEKLPGKARRVLQRICETLDFDRHQLGKEVVEVASEDVIREVSIASGVPEHTLAGIADKQDYESGLKEFIVGQDHAVREMATELGLIKAGLTDSDKPASVVMFVGQTGTGKTEMAKALARLYSPSKRLRTYTLGNMVEPHSVSAIIGVPPGYVGHDAGGKIVHDLNADPYCVFLLDEADKAHPDVMQPFLNLFDEGWVRDQRSAQAYANNAIFILTTNVGQRMIADMAKQGKTPEEMADRMKETLAQIKHAKLNRPVFAPEFLARIKRIIVFQPLSADAMRGIADRHIQSTIANWRTQREKELEIDEPLIAFVAERAHQRNTKSDGKEGGRLVGKLISDHILSPMQRAIADRSQDYVNAKRVIVSANSIPETNGDADGSERPDVTVSFE